jgi:predicted TIM-barrel fold metal-dependent hydrolase
VEDSLYEAGISNAMLIAMPGACSNSFFSSGQVNRSKYWCIGNIDLEDWKFSVDEIRDLDLDGVFIHPRYQGFSLESLLCSDLLSSLEDHNLPIVICGWTQSESVPIESLSPLWIDKIAKKHKNLRILLAHLGGHRYWDAFMAARSNQNVYLDCSYFLDVFRDTSLEADFFASLRLIDQKVIFGSDFPEIDPAAYSSRFIDQISRIREVDVSRLLSENIQDFMHRALT